MPVLNNITHEQIARLHVTGKSGTEIALDPGVGLGLRDVYRILRRKDVKARMSEIVCDVLHDVKIDSEEILMATADIALNPHENTQNRLKALEMLGKNLKMWVERVEDTTDRGHDGWVKLMVKHSPMEEYDFFG